MEKMNREYHDRFLRRTVWVDITMRKFWKIFHRGALKENEGSLIDIVPLSFWLYYLHIEGDIEAFEEEKMVPESIDAILKEEWAYV